MNGLKAKKHFLMAFLTLITRNGRRGKIHTCGLLFYPNSHRGEMAVLPEATAEPAYHGQPRAPRPAVLYPVCGDATFRSHQQLLDYGCGGGCDGDIVESLGVTLHGGGDRTLSVTPCGYHDYESCNNGLSQRSDNCVVNLGF